MKATLRKGFTLVELAIVLVIIGLLIGGILVAQSMIETTKLNDFIRTLQQYEIAAGNFRTNYGCLPGDCDKMSPAGNNNGEIYLQMNGSDSLQEPLNFWPHLYDTGHIKDDYLGYAGYATWKTSLDWKGLSPELKYGKGCFLNVATAPPELGGIEPITNTAVTWAIGRAYYDSGSSQGYFLGCMTSAQALAIDNKLDNSAPYNGKVIVLYPGTTLRRAGLNGGDETTSGCTANSNPVTYDASGNWFSHSGNIQEASGARPDRLDCMITIEVDGLNN